MKIALVTGANRGIGFETARQLASVGYQVWLGARDPDKAAAAAAQLVGEGLTVEPLTLDVADSASIAAAFADLARRVEKLDALVNNAAVHYDSFQSADAVDFRIVDEAWRTNTEGPWRVTVAALPLLRKAKSARVVNVSSQAGAFASMGGGTPAYSVSKAALNALTIKLAADLRKDGILVNSVCPGWTATDMGGGGRPIAEGAQGVVWAANLPPDGPSGGFFRDGKPLPW